MGNERAAGFRARGDGRKSESGAGCKRSAGCEGGRSAGCEGGRSAGRESRVERNRKRSAGRESRAGRSRKRSAGRENPSCSDGFRKWIILAVACFLVFLANYMQFQISAYAYLLIPAVGLTTAQFSSLLMAPMLTAVFASIPAGMLADRYGVKRVILTANLIAVAGAVMRITADQYEAFLVAMFLLGFSPASLNANLIKVFGGWFDDKINLAMGAFYASASAGIVAVLLTAHLFSSMQAAYETTAFALIFGIALWVLCAKNSPANIVQEADGLSFAARDAEPVQRYLGVAARNKHVWLIAVALGFGLASTTAFSGYFPQFLTLGGTADAQEAGRITAFCTAGSIVGGLVGPAICYQLGRYKTFLVTAGTAGGLLMLFSYNIPLAFLSATMAVIGILTSIAGPVLESYPYSLPDIGEKYAGSAGGLIGMVSMAMAFVIPLVISAVCGDSYRLIFGLMGACFLASTACVLLLPEIGEA